MSRLLVWVLVALISVSIPVVALGPLQDDGGSGGDAGDSFQDATPIRPGEVEGVLDGTLDDADHYSLEVAAGQELRVTYDWEALHQLSISLFGPTGSIQAPEGGWSFWGTHALVAKEGTWQVVVAYAAHTIVPEPTAYTFVVSSDEVTISYHQTYADITTAAFEATSSSDEGIVQVHTVSRFANDEPFAYHEQSERQVDGSDSVSAFGLRRAAYSDKVLNYERPDATRDVLQDLHITGTRFTSVMSIHLAAGTDLRQTLLSTGPMTKVTIVASLGTDAPTASYGGNDTLSVTATDLANGLADSPLSVTVRNESYTTQVESRFVGWAELYGGDGMVTDGNGTHYPLDAHHPSWFFIRGPAGDWVLDVHEYQTSPEFPDDVLFFGASVPDLGIYTEGDLGFGHAFTLKFRPSLPI